RTPPTLICRAGSAGRRRWFGWSARRAELGGRVGVRCLLRLRELGIGRGPQRLQALVCASVSPWLGAAPRGETAWPGRSPRHVAWLGSEREWPNRPCPQAESEKLVVTCGTSPPGTGMSGGCGHHTDRAAVISTTSQPKLHCLDGSPSHTIVPAERSTCSP